MSLKEQIETDFLEALKSKNSLQLSTLRLLKSAIKNAEIEAKREFEDSDIINIIEKQAKQRRDSIEQYRSAGREDLKAKEEDELQILEKYLPEKLNEEEVREEVRKALEVLSEADRNNFGKAMGASMQALKGKADPAVVTKVVKEALGG